MTASRPTTIEGMQNALSCMITETGLERGLAFRPDPTDVLISPYSKCGTTWMQQIVHCLRTGGDMNFAEITEVVPWIETAYDMGLDLEAPQKAPPRAFKSHLPWDRIPKGGRYIIVFRDPVDAMLSMFKFFAGWFFQPGSISVEEFAAYYLTRPGGGGYWEHAVSWWGQRDNPDVLMLCFEHMKHDLSGTVDRVSDFIGVQAGPDLRALATEQAGFAFMKQHAGQFDDNLLHRARDAACGLPIDGQSSKVNTGKVGVASRDIPAHIRTAYADKWAKTLGRHHGLADYQALANALA